VLTEKDWDELKHSLALERLQRDWNDADRQTARAHTLAKLELDRQYELKQAEFAQHTDLDRATLDAQLEMERKRLDGQLELQQKRFAAELDTRAKAAEVERQQAQLDDEARRRRVIEGAKANAQIAEIERTQTKADVEEAFGYLRGIKSIKREDEFTRDDQRLKVKREETELQLKIEADQHQREMARLQVEHEQERAILEQKAKMSAEQLIAVSPVDQARLIKELKETEARAVAEQVQLQSQQDTAHSTEFKQLYERLLTQADQSAQARVEAEQRAARMVQDTAHKALDSQRDGMVEVARAVSHGQQPPTSEA
jgi:hypothetical protein